MQLDSWLARRAKGEPLQYIEGSAWFMGLEFGVDPRVLIPRQDTETLVECALELLEGTNAPGGLDTCTGSGGSGLYAAGPGRGFDMILCNPPYLTGQDMQELQKEVTYEPALALFGGEDGLECYRRIAAGLKDHLNPGGYVLLEVGMGQDQDVLKMVTEAIDCAETQVVEDMNGIARVVIAQRKA